MTMTKAEKQAVIDANMSAQWRIASALGEIDEAWGKAWFDCIVSRGRTKGCVKRTKPRDPLAAFLWESFREIGCDFRAWRDARCLPNRSLGGMIFAGWRVDREDSVWARAALRAIVREIWAERDLSAREREALQVATN